RRLAIGVLTLFLVSVIVFQATEVLPGNAAFAVLGRSANPARLHALEHQLHLDQGVLAQYWSWLSGLFTGRLGTSLANGEPVWGLVEPRLVNSAVLVFAAGAIALIIVFSTVVSHLLPAVSLLPPGTYAWSQPELLILPVATLVIVIVP